jgi:hypothetical protein
MSNPRSRMVGPLLCAAMIAGFSLAGRPRSPAATPPQGPLAQAERTAMEDLAGAILERRDAVAAAEARLAERTTALERAIAAHKEAQTKPDEARAVLKSYREATFPQDRDAARAEVARAGMEKDRAAKRLLWAQDMLKNGYLPEAAVTEERGTKQRADLWVDEAKQALLSLEKFTYSKVCKQLELEIGTAVSTLATRSAEWESARLARAEAEKALAEIALTAEESRAILRMDDALRFASASARGADAREALEDAARLWRASSPHRAALRSTDLRRRMTLAATRVRTASAVPASSMGH